MSDPIKHECGLAFVRLLKPLDFYTQKYGTPFYGINKLYLMMQKQHNRGQDGVGIASVKLYPRVGDKYMYRRRSSSTDGLKDIFAKIHSKIQNVKEKHEDLLHETEYLKSKLNFLGEVMLGHLRYGTHGKSGVEFCHPVKRINNWMTRSLFLAGNFNLTNVDELFDLLVNLGQHPIEKSDTTLMLEKFGHFLDQHVQEMYDYFKHEGYAKAAITPKIIDALDLLKVIKRSTAGFDGGYTIGGMLGSGDAFVLRDPNGIRPAYYYANDEIVVAASERPAIQAALNLKHSEVSELPPAHALMVKRNGDVSIEAFVKVPKPKTACSFERIYFSRGTDKEIYRERIALGNLLTTPVLEAVNYDLENTVFSYIPNTAEISFYGMLRGVEDYINQKRKKIILQAKEQLDEATLEQLFSLRPRAEKIPVKDYKLRTFITEDALRDELVSHVYDITYGTIRRNVDTLVVVDDSIVRGTTLQKSILAILDRLDPVKIIVVSSAPQIRYPDCYGIDMSKLGDFVAFKALIKLLEKNNQEYLLENTYHTCLSELKKPFSEVENKVKPLYDLFSDEQLNEAIAEIVRPQNCKAAVQVIFQSVENLHQAMPEHRGDWYFTGNYPTPGGNKVVNKAFINYYEKVNERAY
ncbi:MAG: amidophosphoribosyltransferase [Chitinophagales bacterium]